MFDRFIQGLRVSDEEENDEFIDNTMKEESVRYHTQSHEGKRNMAESNRTNGSMSEIGNSNIIIMKPKKLNEAKDIIDKLQEGNTVAVDLAYAAENEKQRIMDMLAGYCYCTQSNIESINTDIYIISHTEIELNQDN